MGCHIEMTRFPGKDYPISTIYQPEEPPLQMMVDRLVVVRDAAMLVAGKRGVHRRDDFVIFNGPCYGEATKQLAKGTLSNLLSWL